MKSWPLWVLFVMGSVVWGLPQFSHYQEGLPYLYPLGGPALVAWYIGLGFLSLGTNQIWSGLMGRPTSRVKVSRVLCRGGGSVVLACLFGSFYFVLMDLAVSLQ